MRSVTKTFTSIMLFFALCLGASAYSQTESPEDRTLSPYFFVKSDDPQVDQLPLKSTSVRVNVCGVIADVVVTQVYKNEGKRPLEAIYVFPASTKAAVYGMKMTIGERTITAKIAKREDARKEYEQAKQAGKSASLLEQQRPNVFRMNVANILPSDVVKVELKYTELLVPTHGIYEFVYPTVVGPRYTSDKEGDTPSSEAWFQNPYFKEGERPSYDFHIAAHIVTGIPIQEITCPSHKVNVGYLDKSSSTVTLDSSEKSGGNRDFILKYRLAGNRIETGLLLHKGEKENFFLLMLEPPKRVSQHAIPSREYIFIVDVSGSMHGFPLDISKELLRDLIGHLRPSDRFNVLLFAGGSSLMAQQSVPASKENVERALHMIDRQKGGGGTEILPALQRALALPRAEGFSRTVVVVTDGYVTVEPQVFDLIRNHLDKANMFAFGIGTAVNRHIIEGMAHVGMGEPFVVTKPLEAREKAKKFREMILTPVLSGIKIDFGEFETYDVEPATVPDVLAERPVTVFGKWRGETRGHIRLHGLGGEGPFTADLDVGKVKPAESNNALCYLWARHRITLLSDYNLLSRDDRRVKEVTDLGLSYNMLTAYTSFVAVDTLVRSVDGESVTVKQPLPLPEGVSNLAVGRGSGPVPYSKSIGALHTLAPMASAPRYKSQYSAGEVRDESLEFEGKDKDSSSPQTAVAGRGAPHLTLKSVKVGKGIAEEDVRRVVERAMEQFRACFRSAQQGDSQLKGPWRFMLVVGPDGKVVQVRPAKPEERPDSIRKCMLQALRGLDFGAGKTKDKLEVELTFEAR